MQRPQINMDLNCISVICLRSNGTGVLIKVCIPTTLMTSRQSTKPIFDFFLSSLPVPMKFENFLCGQTGSLTKFIFEMLFHSEIWQCLCFANLRINQKWKRTRSLSCQLIRIPEMASWHAGWFLSQQTCYGAWLSPHEVPFPRVA